jgi:hypothetical protein
MNSRRRTRLDEYINQDHDWIDDSEKAHCILLCDGVKRYAFE